MKKLVLSILIMLYSYLAYSQQEYKFKYKFSPKVCKRFHFENQYLFTNSGDFYTYEPSGIYLDGDDVDIIESKVIKSNYIQRNFPPLAKAPVGRITKRSGDTLFIEFWQITGTGPIDETLYNDKEFIYLLDNSWINNRFRVPFRYRMMTAANLPFRITFNNGKLNADFLNFNVTYMFMRGKTTFFKQEFIKPRYRQFGLGPFLGMTSINDSEDELKEFGVAYGINAVISIIQDFNITVAFGFENGFTNSNQNTSFVGIGLGYKLVDLYDPRPNEE